MANPHVDPDVCIGCGLCAELCPEVFKMVDDIAVVHNAEACEGLDSCQEAADACPVDAISL